MKKRWDELTPDDFPHRAREIIRYSDTDALEHVNNASFATYLEAGHAALTADENGNDYVPGTGIVLAQLNLSYKREMRWPGEVQIGTGIVRFGRTSFELLQAIFQDGRCTATAQIILVVMSSETRRAIPIPEELLPILSPYQFDLELA